MAQWSAEHSREEKTIINRMRKAGHDWDAIAKKLGKPVTVGPREPMRAHHPISWGAIHPIRHDRFAE